MHEAQQPGTMIQSRYKIQRVLGQGGSGITYAAEDCFIGRIVALKELSLRGLSDWKKLELFEREAKVLEGLQHPAIPKYVDYFQVDTADNRYFYIAQELAEGKSLAQWVDEGERFDEGEVRRIALAVLDILQYLHGLNPPLIHRDIKPQNIIRHKDGRIFLVDFGAVQRVYRDTVSFGSTVVGTYGYMAPEQFRGHAYPTTDLYGLGATLLTLLTHQPPSDLPQKRLKIDFRPYVTVSAPFADWLDKLIEPLVEDRFGSAAIAIAALTQPQPSFVPLPLTPQMVRRQPAGSRIKFQRDRDRLSLEIPPAGFRGETLGIGCFALFWNGFLVVWTSGAMVAAAHGAWFFPLFSIPFWIVGLGMIGMLLNGLAGRTSLAVQGDRFTFKHEVLGWRHIRHGKTYDLEGAELRVSYTSNGRPVETIHLHEGVYRTHKFGTMLSRQEKEWLMAELEDFIRQLPPR